MNDSVSSIGHTIGVIALAIISLAVLVVLFAPGSKTTDVIGAAGRAFGGILAIVLTPVTGGTNLGSVGSSLLQTASFSSGGGGVDPLEILGGGGFGGGSFGGFGGGGSNDYLTTLNTAATAASFFI